MTLLTQPYSSCNCIETDHCLSIHRAGLKVIYHPGLVAVHLAKPRPDMSELSLRWHLNSIRNPLYVYLKHFGPFGKHGAALTWTLTKHVGLLSMLRRPTRANVDYFANSVRAKASAYWHWIKYLSGPRRDSPEAFLAVMAADERALANTAESPAPPPAASKAHVKAGRSH
jgi:GT2 family glycosyltransferase